MLGETVTHPQSSELPGRGSRRTLDPLSSGILVLAVLGIAASMGVIAHPAVPGATGAWDFVPLALFGLMTGLTLALRRRGDFSAAPNANGLYVLGLSAVGLGYLFFLARAGRYVFAATPSSIVLGVSMAALLLTASIAAPPPLHTLPRRLASDLRLVFGSPAFSWTVAAVVASAGIAGGLREKPRPFDLERWYSSQEPIAELVSPGVVTMTEFIDFQCPPCRETYRAQRALLASVEKKHPGLVRFRLAHYPLDSSCNPALTTPRHPLACEAAAAVVLAERRGQAESLIDWIFDHQEGLTRDALVAAARAVGGVIEYEKELPDAMAEVATDVARANRYGVSGTPTLFFQGRLLEENAAPIVKQLLAHESRQQQARTAQAIH